MRCKRHNSSRARAGGVLTRYISAFLLALILPAVVIAAPLRYCAGQNGHRAIEIAHAKVLTHAGPDAKHSIAPEDVRHTPHVSGSDCEDKLLLPLVAKSKPRCVPRPSVEPVLGRDFHIDLRASTQWLAHLTSRLVVVHLRKPDPRLDTLRTVVLLN
ncbi:hypothetical protein HYPP_02723 [Hyphomicrobium sp. ghe19]|nr:hypothetical protein HYPP_02723 [Hyphomicrobium sp. ghe19]